MTVIEYLEILNARLARFKKDALEWPINSAEMRYADWEDQLTGFFEISDITEADEEKEAGND